MPPPGRYRKLIGQTVAALANAEPAPDARDILLEAILDGEQADRVAVEGHRRQVVRQLDRHCGTGR